MDIREKFGTSWIGASSPSAAANGPNLPEIEIPAAPLEPSALELTTPAAATPSGSPSPSDATDICKILARAMIRSLQQTNGVDTVYNIADRLQRGPEELAPVVEWLAMNYYIRVHEGKFGNHELRLTDRANELVSEKQRAPDLVATS